MTDYFWAFLIAFAVCVGLLFALLPFLKRKKVGQEILIYVTEHDAKKGTPTMGGIAFVIAIALSALMFTKGKSQLVNVTLAVMVAYGATGFLDDFLKVYKKRNLGLRAYQKILLQLSIAVIMAFFVKNNVIVGDSIFIPFSNGLTVSFGWLIIPFVIFIFLAVTNGVNLTDGLDGLASSVTLCYMLGMVALLLVEKERLVMLGDTILSTECEQLIFVCVASIGGLLAFLLFNCFPAKIFMGDTGSLALGGVVACVSILPKLGLYIPILGIVYVVSCLSVVLQVGYFKVTKGKRLFLMAPYHHHLQKKGLSETRIACVYCVVTIVACVLLLVFGG